VVGRLVERYASLEKGVDVPALAPLPARVLPEGLVPLPLDEMPLYSGMEVVLEQLDALLQSMASRVRRVVAERMSNAPQDAFGDDLPAVDPALKMFTSLPPEFTLAQLKSDRAELEAILTKGKDKQGVDS